MIRTTGRQGPSVASIRRAIQQGIGRPDSPAPPSTRQGRETPQQPDLFEQANVNFTEKKWVWVPDVKEGYIAGYVVEEGNGDDVQVHLMTGRDVVVNINETEKVNPPKFEKVDDMADLGYLNEASVVHNLKQRYASSMIYTYSGLFLVAVNPYYNLQIYGSEYISAYRNKKRSEVAPHIFAIADASYHDMLHSKENQSILITGESGAGKTENTKKVIQYLTAIASERGQDSTLLGSSLEQQILCANPILESFGNAQTIRNNNSSRFGKFIRIEFNFSGHIAGASIEWYLFEKPRVTNQSKQERNYHIFYQLMKGADASIKNKLLIDKGPEGYLFTQRCNSTIQGVDDREEYETLVRSMEMTGFKPGEQIDFFRIVASVLHLGNMKFQATRNDEAILKDQVAAEKACHVLGIQLSEFTRALLRPSIKAGRDWVTQSRTLQQVLYSVEALARSIYERMFGALVSRINAAMGRPDGRSTFIGVLDIAGFEILETNSFEQLCINYTNERLQQFFNRTMFVLEQEEYKREGIEWNFIDFGMDLQPTIDLIDKAKPIGIMSCLDEECVMPKATDKTFTEKLHSLWTNKSDKYEVPRFAMGFIVNHYASQVEYSTEGWLEKNKDPLNENVTRLLSNSSEPFVAQLYSDYLGSDGTGPIEQSPARSRMPTSLKRGTFRTVGQRHKDQLNLLMAQLNSTQPHFVRCILPNSEKRAGKIDTPQVLEQLRCNGVLEGIRITRQGFPNRIPFPEFRQRYEILAPNTIPRQMFVDSKQAASLLLEALQMDKAKYRLGHTKVFFRAGVLAELEEVRDVKLSHIITQLQAVARGAISRSRFRRRIEQAKAIRVIQRNARVYNQLCEWPWWKLYRTVKPLLHVTRVDEELRKKDTLITDLESKAKAAEEERERIEQERVDLEREKSEIENMLITERSAAIDQEEFLKRTQEREAALEDSLREHSAELECLEEQCEELIKTKTELEDKLHALEEQIESEAGAMRDLTEQQQEKADALSAAEQELEEYKQHISGLESDRDAAEKHIIELESTLAMSKDIEVQVSEELESMRKELEAKDKQLQSKEESETELAAASAKATADIAQLEKALSDAEKQYEAIVVESEKRAQQIATIQAEQQALEKERSSLAIKLDSTEQSLSSMKQEKQRAAESNIRMEQEIAELRKLIDEKSDQGTREVELRRMREEELAALRTELSEVSSELEDFRKAHIEAEEAMRGESDEIRRERDAAVQERDALKGNNKDLEDQLMEHNTKLSELEETNMQLEAQLSDVTTKSREIETVFEDAKRNHSEVSQDLERLKISLSDTEAECASLSNKLDNANATVETECKRREEIEQELAKVLQTVKELEARLEENEAIKDDYQQRITTQSQEYEELKEKYHEEAVNRNKQLEDAREEAIAELDDLRTGYDELESRCSNLEKARSRLTSELEDLKLENERERSHALDLEKANNEAQSNIVALESKLEESKQNGDKTRQEATDALANAESLKTELAKRDEQIESLKASKGDIERELKNLIDEVGDGARNVHELEKARQELEGTVSDLNMQLDEALAAQQKAEEVKARWEQQHNELQKKLQDEIAAKEVQSEESRRLLLQEINTLGEKLAEETSALERMKHEKEEVSNVLQRVQKSADQSTRSRSEFEDAKRDLESRIREAEVEIEAQSKSLKDYEALASRHEKKSASLQDLLESRDMEITQLARKLQRLERRLEEVMAQAAYHLDARNRLDNENVELREKLEEAYSQLGQAEHTARDLANVGKSRDIDSSTIRRIEEDAEDRIRQVEESRKALTAALRVAQQEVEEKQNELTDLDLSYGSLQSELHQVRESLSNAERERDEATDALAHAKEQLATERSMRGNKEELSNELSEKLESLHENLSTAEAAIQEAEDNRRRSEKMAANAKSEVEYIQASLDEAVKARNTAEEMVHSLEAQSLELQGKLDENAMTIAELEHVRDGLQHELDSVTNRHRNDLDDHERTMTELRTTYQKELEDTIQELETVKKDHIELREAYINLDSDLATKSQDLDKAREEEKEAKKELMRIMAKLEEIAPAYEQARDTAKALEEELATAKRELESTSARAIEAEALRDEMRSAKEKLELRLDEVQNKYIEASKGRQTAEKAALQLEDEVRSAKANLQEINEHQSSAEDRAVRLDAVVADVHVALDKEREANTILTKEKNNLEKQLKALKLRIVELETEAVAIQAKENRRFQPLPPNLASKIEAQAKSSLEHQQKVKQMERQIRELQFQIGERDKTKKRQDSELDRLGQKMKRLEEQVRDLEKTEEQLTAAKYRLERELGAYRSRTITPIS